MRACGEAAAVPHLRPAPRPPPSSRLPFPSAPRVPTPTPRSVGLPKLGQVPASPCPWWRGSPRSPDCSLVGEEVSDPEPELTFSCLPPYLCPQDFLLAFPVRTALEEMLPRLDPVRAPPALSGGLLLCPREVLASKAVTRPQLVESCTTLDSACLCFSPLDLCDRALQARQRPRGVAVSAL